MLESVQCTLALPERLENWAGTLVDAGVDDMAIAAFARLASRDRCGDAEATRLLQHLLKPGASFASGPSRWMMKAIEEAERYLDGGWREWEERRDPREWASGTSRSSWPAAPPAPAPAPGAPWAPPHLRGASGASGSGAPRLPPGQENPWAGYHPSG